MLKPAQKISVWLGLAGLTGPGLNDPSHTTIATDRPNRNTAMP